MATVYFWTVSFANLWIISVKCKSFVLKTE